MNKSWIFPEKVNDRSMIDQIVKDYTLNPVIAELMVQRGISDQKTTRMFVNSGLKYTHSPYLLKDMDIAVRRIRKAIENNESIMIYGDKDVDGITSVSIMYYALKEFGIKDVKWLLPIEGYGLGNKEVEEILKSKPSLVITVDNGIAAEEYIKVLSENGIDVIVTDHHEPVTGIPESALAVIDPKREDCKYPFTNLAGCGVAFKLCLAIVLSYDKDFMFDKTIVCYDFETTGLSGVKDEVIEIGAVKVINSIIIDKFDTLVKPDSRTVNAEVEAITGITGKMVEDGGISQGEAFRKFSTFIDDCYIMGHNSDRFDSVFLKNSLSRKNISYPKILGEIDTIKISRPLFPKKKHNLAALCTFFDISEGAYHRALSDAEMTLNLYYSLILYKSEAYRLFFRNYIDLLTLGTVADIMPLTDENRIFVKWGLKCLSSSPRLGIKALMKSASVDPKTLTSRNISFNIAPRLNTAHRMGVTEKSLNLVLSENKVDAQRLAEELEELNTLRRERVDEYYNIFEEEMLKSYDPENDLIIVVAVSGLKHGVTGIVASRLVDKYSRPVIAMVIEEPDDNGEQIAAGSARSIENYSIIEALEQTDDLLRTFGGHTGAAGFTIKSENISEFKKKIVKWSKKTVSKELLVPKLHVDLELNIKEITPKLYKELSIMAPFGVKNPEPLFVLRDAEIANIKKLGAEGLHLKITLKQGNGKIECLFWNSTEKYYEKLQSCKKIDIAGKLELNSWFGMQKAQLMVEDIKVK
ncbi:single-stranded-DNA-specific exonuclease RecJ [bacterium]|nr:single-stranded-DNA-specific exonuclease RecJ [bacterium]